MKKLISLVITLSLVITMLASVTVFADAPVSSETVTVKSSSKVKFRSVGSAAYGTTAISDGSDIEVVTSDTTGGTTYRKIRLEGSKDAIADNVGYTVIEFTLNSPHAVDHNLSTLTNLKTITVYLQNFGTSTSVRAYIDGSGAWNAAGEDNKVSIVVAWNEGEMYTYVNGYMKQAIEVPFSKDPLANARRVDIETKFGSSSKTTAEYALYTLSDYSINHYSSFDPSWLDLSAVKYSYGWVENEDDPEKSGYKYSINTAMRGYRTSSATLSNAGNEGTLSGGELFFAVYDEEGRLTGVSNTVSTYSSGAARTSNLTAAQVTGAHKLFLFRDGMYPLFTSKFINALPAE